MSLFAIRTALAGYISGVNGITKCEAYEPGQSMEITPFAFLGEAETEIQVGSLEIWVIRLPLFVVVGEKGYREDESKHVESFVDPVLTVLRGHQNLTNDVAATMCTGFSETTVTRQEKQYRAVVFGLELEAKFEVANQYAA